MAFIEQFQLLQRIDRLIARKGTGSAKELGSLVGISRSSVFNYFDILRSFGAEIDYCEVKKSYYYVDGKKPRLPVLSASDSENIHGGKTFFNIFPASPEFLDCDVSPLYHVDRQEEKHYAGNCPSFWL